MSLKKDIIEAEFRTTGANKLQHDIGATQGEIKRLNKENEMLLINKKKLEAQGKKDTKGYKQLTAEIKKNNEAIKTEKTRLTELNSKLKITEMTARQLLIKKRSLTRELNNTSKALNPKKWNQLNGELKKVTTQYGKVQVGGRGVNGVMKKMGALLPVVGFAALLSAGKRLLTNIIDVRKEFEKYEAILKVSLGSQRSARQEMGMLAKFAADTPFQLSGLTDAFVKLTNQGFKPNRAEMTKLGDLTAAMGKDFDQLTEAIIDAQTGEFERLKEFGIRASKQGDKVKFSFKEVETQVGFTASEIRKYILGLGEMEGISGSMAEISKTLGGRISNLGDAWDTLMNTMGQRSSGIMVSIINWAIDVVEKMQMVSKSIKQIKMEVMDELTSQNLQKAIVEIDIITQGLVKRGVAQAKAEKRAVELYTESVDYRIAETKRALDSATLEEQEFLQKKMDLLVNEKQALKDHFFEVAKLEKKARDAYLAQQTAEQKLKAEEEKTEREKKKNQLLAELKLQYQEELKLLKEQLQNKELTQQEYEDLLINIKIASLELEKEIRRQAGEDIVAIENQIMDLEIGMMNTLSNEQDRIRKEQEKLDEKAREKKKKEDKQALEEEVQMYEDKLLFFTDAAADMAASIGEAIASGEADMQDLLRKSLLVALKYLRDFARAKIFITSVATGGLAGIARAAVLTVLVEGSYAAAKTLLTKKADSKQLFTGGPTGLGGKYEPAGIVHKNEYVIPEEGFFNPALRPFLNLIEEARRAGTLRSLNMTQPSSRGYADGGPTTQMLPAAPVTDPALVNLLEANIALLSMLRNEGVYAYIGDPQTRDLRDRIQFIERIEASVSK